MSYFSVLSVRALFTFKPMFYTELRTFPFIGDLFLYGVYDSFRDYPLAFDHRLLKLNK